MKSLYLIPMAVAAMYAGSASANPTQASQTLRAHVDSFCRVDGAIADELTIQEVTPLGDIREVCNTQGYIVRAAFTNLAGGTVVAGADRAGIDAGTAEFRYGQAQARIRPWQLYGAVRQNAAAPVYLMVSITPL